MPGARMDQPLKPDTDVARSRRLREEADEARRDFGKVMQELVHTHAAMERQLAAQAAELRARMRGCSPAPQAVHRPPLGASDEVGDR